MVLLGVVSLLSPISGQVSFVAKSSPNINFSFGTIQQYQSGITYFNALELNVDADSRWELQVGAITDVVDEWNNNLYYSSQGDNPPVSMVELRFRNSSSTSLITGFTPLTDVSNPIIVIGDGNIGSGTDINCPDQGTNVAGDYITTPSCYQFDVDIRIKPGLATDYRAGLYNLTIEYTIIEDL